MYFSVNYNPKVKKKNIKINIKKEKNLKKISKIGHGTDLRRSPPMFVAIGYEHRHVGYPWKELSKTSSAVQTRPL